MLGTIHCLGYVHEGVAVFGPNFADDKEDPVIRDLMYKHGIFEHFDRTAFGRIRETHWGANRGIMKYDGPLGPPDLPKDELAEAEWLMGRVFAPYFGTCEVIGEDEVEMDPDTHCGWEYKSLLKYRNKGEVMRNPFTRDEVVRSWYSPDHPTIWKCSFKGGELLKRKKVDNNDGRVFIVPDIRFLYWQIRMFHSMHKLFVKLSQDTKFPFKMGYAFQFQGFSRLLEELFGYSHIVEGDVSKWDSAMWEYISLLAGRLYSKLFKAGVHCTTQQEYDVRLEFIMNEICYTIIIMPSGQVLLKKRGNPSGQYITGDLNCIWHWFIVCLMYLKADKKQDLRRDAFWLLGDDHIFGTNSEALANFDFRRSLYLSMGSDLNKEKDLVSSSPIGHTFLGFTAQWDELRKRLVPVFNIEKALCSALKPGGSVTPALRYARLTGLRILTFFSPGYDMIKALARDCYQDGYVINEPTDVTADALKFLLTWPDDSVIERLWLGYESGLGGRGGLNSETTIELSSLTEHVL